MKYCRGCSTDKPLCEFGRHAIRRDGLRDICKLCNAAAARRWARDNPEKIRDYTASYYRQNTLALIAKSKAWASSNPQKARAIKAKWSKANPEAVRDTNAAYRAANKGARAAHDALIRVRKHGGLYAEFGSTEWAEIVRIYDTAQEMSDRDGVLYHVDHIAPIAEGGGHFSDNLQIITAYEHRRKSALEQSRAAARRWDKARNQSPSECVDAGRATKALDSAMVFV